MKKTSVEFLEKEITQIMSYFEEDGAYDMKGAQDKLFGEKNIFHQAKAMEKQQIEDAFIKGDISRFNETPEDYYNQTFKQD